MPAIGVPNRSGTAQRYAGTAEPTSPHFDANPQVRLSVPEVPDSTGGRPQRLLNPEKTVTVPPSSYRDTQRWQRIGSDKAAILTGNESDWQIAGDREGSAAGTE